jgi:hypothetical protein
MKWLADRGLVSLTGNWQTDPGYLFRLAEGQKLLENSAAARGGLLSGQTGKALQEYGQNFASNEFGNIYDRYRGLIDAGYGRHLDDYKGRVAEREAKFDKLTGQSGTGLKTLAQLAELAFGSQQADNRLSTLAAGTAADARMKGGEYLAGGLASAFQNLGTGLLTANNFSQANQQPGTLGGFVNPWAGDTSNTGTFGSNLARNTAFQNFGPKPRGLWE